MQIRVVWQNRHHPSTQMLQRDPVVADLAKEVQAEVDRLRGLQQAGRSALPVLLNWPRVRTLMRVAAKRAKCVYKAGQMVLLACQVGCAARITVWVPPLAAAPRRQCRQTLSLFFRQAPV